MLKLLAALAEMANRLTGNYQSRVKDSLIDTGDSLVSTLSRKSLSEIRKAKLVNHYCRQWRANRKKLR